MSSPVYANSVSQASWFDLAIPVENQPKSEISCTLLSTKNSELYPSYVNREDTANTLKLRNQLAARLVRSGPIEYRKPDSAVAMHNLIAELPGKHETRNIIVNTFADSLFRGISQSGIEKRDSATGQPCQALISKAPEGVAKDNVQGILFLLGSMQRNHPDEPHIQQQVTKLTTELTYILSKHASLDDATGFGKSLKHSNKASKLMNKVEALVNSTGGCDANIDIVELIASHQRFAGLDIETITKSDIFKTGIRQLEQQIQIASGDAASFTGMVDLYKIKLSIFDLLKKNAVIVSPEKNRTSGGSPMPAEPSMPKASPRDDTYRSGHACNHTINVNINLNDILKNISDRQDKITDVITREQPSENRGTANRENKGSENNVIAQSQYKGIMLERALSKNNLKQQLNPLNNSTVPAVDPTPDGAMAFLQAKDNTSENIGNKATAVTSGVRKHFDVKMPSKLVATNGSGQKSGNHPGTYS